VRRQSAAWVVAYDWRVNLALGTDTYGELSDHLVWTLRGVTSLRSKYHILRDANGLPLHATTVLRTFEQHYNDYRPHRTLGQTAQVRPLTQRTTAETNTLRRRDRLGGLLHEYQQVA
jgi:hypothetical protein